MVAKPSTGISIVWRRTITHVKTLLSGHIGWQSQFKTPKVEPITSCILIFSNPLRVLSREIVYLVKVFRSRISVKYYFAFGLISSQFPKIMPYFLSARTVMWSVPVVLTKTENENDSANQNYVAKMTLQKWRCKMMLQTLTMLCADGIISGCSFN